MQFKRATKFPATSASQMWLASCSLPTFGILRQRYFKKVDGYAALIPFGSNLGKLYRLAKVHKNNTLLRPIVSMVGNPEYRLAKYLDSLIKPQIKDTYFSKSTDNFIEHLKQFPCNNSLRIVSFDVSLFTRKWLFCL